MLCFTGGDGFKTWRELFGAEWVDQQRAKNLAGAAAETYFDGSRYYQLNSGVWFDKSREDLLLDIRANGVSGNKREGQTISDAERVLYHVQVANRVHGAAPLIYNPPGVVDVGGMRILNTSTLRPIEPCGRVCTSADFPFLFNFVQGLFASPEMNPRDYFLAWLQRAYRSIRELMPLMGQAVFFCGPVNNGKTLASHWIVRPLLGGRSANPYKFLVGDTDFTDELFGAALWAINDEESPSRESEKAAFLAKIKASVVNPEQTYHPKFCKKMSLPWQRRIMVTSNDDPQSVGMLPEVNDSTRDKLMFFATRAHAGKWPERTELEATIKKELPNFARWLLDWEPPDSVMESGRMGVKSYFDPQLLEVSNQQSQFYNFKELLCLWAKGSQDEHGKLDEPVWVGNPTELRAALSVFDHMADMLREWTVPKITKALTGLVRVGRHGVAFVEGTQQRTFKLDKAVLLKTT